jgi:predicted CoA-binding protein
MSNKTHTVVVLGASNKPDRYSNKAIRLLKLHQYCVVPVHPRLETIEGFSVVHHLEDIEEEIHTLTLYVGPQQSQELIESIVKVKPHRIILNPGTESEVLESALTRSNIPFIKGCTLVMLRSGQF